MACINNIKTFISSTKLLTPNQELPSIFNHDLLGKNDLKNKLKSNTNKNIWF